MDQKTPRSQSWNFLVEIGVFNYCNVAPEYLQNGGLPAPNFVFLEKRIWN